MIVFVSPRGDAHGLDVVDVVVGKPEKTVPKLIYGQIPYVYNVKGLALVCNGRQNVSKLQVVICFAFLALPICS